jgi:monoamine oxidase
VPDPRTVIVLGGGVDGVIAARELRRRLPRQHRVLPAEPKPEVTLRMPSWRWHVSKGFFEKSWLYTKL